MKKLFLRQYSGKLDLRHHLVILTIALAGIFYIKFIWSDHQKGQSEQALQVALSVEASMTTENIQRLTANPADTSLREYRRIKEKLKRVVAVNPQSKFAYFYLLRDNKLFFMVDSEAKDSPDLSPPGQEFEEADSIDFLPFRTGLPQITRPVTDRWGTWISVEVPVKSKTSDEVVAVYGMDYTAELWNRNIFLAVLESSILVIISLVLIIMILMSRIKNRSLKIEITNRKFAEEKLIQTDLQLSNLLKNLPGMAYRCAFDEDYTMLYIGESCTRITGYRPEDFVEKKSISFNDIILTEYRESIWTDWQKVIANRQVFESEYQIKTASGEIKWLWERGRGVFNEYEELLYLEGYIEEITVIKLNNEELIKAKEKAEESDRLKSAFLANISHEIRTPMNGILGFAELLKEPDLSLINQMEFIEMIETSGQRMLNIINDLIDISKIESGETTIHIKTTNITHMLRELNSFFTPEAKRKGLEINYSHNLRDDSYTFETDGQKLNQILSNLIKNALKFTERGFINYGCQLHNSKLRFFVTDTGPGIPPDQKDVIFERFRQGTMFLTRRHEGAGLGLSISKAYVELLGGQIQLESEIDKGSTFWFELPQHLSQKRKKRD
jgi:PAS domain S-box-containing protein